jgi:hypothetical protein
MEFKIIEYWLKNPVYSINWISKMFNVSHLFVENCIKKYNKEPYIIRNVDEVRFQELKSLQDNLFKDQVMVDEATDFSVLQLACMEAMTNPLLNSFFA